ncbi:hypothetical protein J2W23_003397 [Variovorax boronicumulans]|uniref:hypothetical protein n=1 Tax=Variovorax boronicumulans TaxID=436515 RepID=UPI002783B803|nr:hypothetical protein [Variovorax boronicumulans]MDQ0014998.1 hypothetical protein [Variovorax boronicumulans]
MIKKIALSILIFPAFSICLSQEISALKTSNQSLILKKGDQSLNCTSKTPFESFRYSGDRRFLLFNYFDEQLKASLFLGFIKLSDAYDRCNKNAKIEITREPAGDNILDISEAGKIYLTYQEDMYSIGGSALHSRTYVAVKSLKTSKEIRFPFSVKRRDSERLTMKKVDLIGGPNLIDTTKIPEKVHIISKDGKYIVPLGTSCSAEDFYMGIWNVETRKQISAKEIDDLIRKGVRCKDMFG